MRPVYPGIVPRVWQHVSCDTHTLLARDRASFVSPVSHFCETLTSFNAFFSYSKQLRYFPSLEVENRNVGMSAEVNQ